MTDLIWNESLKRFEFSFRVNEHSWDIFKDLIDLFKQLYMSYDGSSKVWYVDDKRIDEILIWLHKEDYKVFCDQSALDKIQNIKDSYKKEIKYLRGLQFDKSIINPDIKLFEYQEKGIQWRIKRNVYLDADDAGLGKTLQEILVFSNLYKQNFIDGIIILVPNGLTYHWFYEILKFVNVFNEDDIGIIDNSVKRQPYSKLEFKNKKILIIPNHIFHHTLLSYKSDYKPTKSFKRIRWEKFVDIKKEWIKKIYYF